MNWTVDNFDQFVDLYVRNIDIIHRLSRHETILPDIVAVFQMLAVRRVDASRGGVDPDFINRNVRPGRLFLVYTDDLSLQTIYLVFNDRIESIIPESPNFRFVVERLDLGEFFEELSMDEPLNIAVYTSRTPRPELITRYLRRP